MIGGCRQKLIFHTCNESAEYFMADTISMTDKGLVVPDNPVIPFIEGDGSGPDIWKVTRKVVDEAIRKAYGSNRQIEWKEVLAGEKAFNTTGEWLPEETVDMIRTYLVAIKAPLSTPVGGGIRSLNVALRQKLNLYACVRPVRYFTGTPSPLREPEKVDMVIFRENTEDVYAGMELQKGEASTRSLLAFLDEQFGWHMPEDTGIGIKPVSEQASKRLVRAAVYYAIEEKRTCVTLVHKGNIQKFTEGAFMQWGYELAKEEFGDYITSDYEEADNGKILINDVIADNFLQQIIKAPQRFDVVATTNLNGDYISDAAAALVGGIGIAPGANINYSTGHALFEATHGTAPKYAGQNKVNPSSLLLSAERMLRYMEWYEAADAILNGIEGAIANKKVTYDFARQMAEEITPVTCSGFGDAVIAYM